MTSRQITCTLCPNGCTLEVTTSGLPTAAPSVEVQGNLCPRGISYALEEAIRPRRTLTTSVLVLGGVDRLASVKTSQPIPREHIGNVREELRGLCVRAPVAVGEVVARDVYGLGIDVVTTRAVERASA
jgi:CxxC motif-containing protein